jgi:hypothetical protein
MVEKPQTRRVKCPNCSWERSIQVQALVDSSLTDVVRGVGEALGASVQRIREVLRNAELDAANARFDIQCSNCGQTYYYNVVTGTVER